MNVKIDCGDGMSLRVMGVEVTSIRQDKDGHVTVEGKVLIAIYEGTIQMGRGTIALTSEAQGLLGDIPDLIKRVTDNLLVIAGGYAVGLTETLLPLAERLSGDFANDTNKGN